MRMPRRCSIYGCRSNYDNETKSWSTFTLPKIEPLRSQWLKKIPTDFSRLKNPIVCIKHFEESSIIRTDVVISKGEKKEYPRILPKLKEGTVPTIFPNTPKYINAPSSPRRLVDVDVEEERFQQAIDERLKIQAYKEKDIITNICDISSYISSKSDLHNWVLQGKPANLYDINNPDWIPSKNMGYDNRVSSEKISRYDKFKKRRLISESPHSRKRLKTSLPSLCLPLLSTDIPEIMQHKKAAAVRKAGRLNKRRKLEESEETAVLARDMSTLNQYEMEDTLSSNETSFSSNSEETELVTAETLMSLGQDITSGTSESAMKKTDEGCDSNFYLEPLDMDQRDKAFGSFVACELSDLRANPALYMKTKQSILKMLTEAHFEQMNSCKKS